MCWLIKTLLWKKKNLTVINIYYNNDALSTGSVYERNGKIYLLLKVGRSWCQDVEDTGVKVKGKVVGW